MWPVGGHPVPGTELRNALSHSLHHAHIAIAQWQRLVQLVENGIHGRFNPIRLHLLQDLLHFIRLLFRLLNEIGLTELHQHPFCAQGYQGTRGADEYLSGLYQRGRDFLKQGMAVFQVLDELFHVSANV